MTTKWPICRVWIAYAFHAIIGFCCLFHITSVFANPVHVHNLELILGVPAYFLVTDGHYQLSYQQQIYICAPIFNIYSKCILCENRISWERRMCSCRFEESQWNSDSRYMGAGLPEWLIHYSLMISIVKLIDVSAKPCKHKYTNNGEVAHPGFCSCAAMCWHI